MGIFEGGKLRELKANLCEDCLEFWVREDFFSRKNPRVVGFDFSNLPRGRTEGSFFTPMVWKVLKFFK